MEKSRKLFLEYTKANFLFFVVIFKLMYIAEFRAWPTSKFLLIYKFRFSGSWEISFCKVVKTYNASLVSRLPITIL